MNRPGRRPRPGFPAWPASFPRPPHLPAFLAMLALLAGAPWGCARRPPPGEPTRAAASSREEFFASFGDSGRRLDRFRARVYLDWFEPGERPRTLTGDVLFDRALGLRIRAGVGTVATVFDLTIRGEEFVLLDAVRGEAVVSDSAVAVLEDLGHPFLAGPFLEAVRLATGGAPAAGLAFRAEGADDILLEGCARGGASGSDGPGGPGGARAGDSAEIALLRYDDSTRLREARLGCPGVARIAFGEYRKAGPGRLPYRVDLREEGGRGRMVIRFRSVEANAKIPVSVFDLRPPARFLVLGPSEIAERFEGGLLGPPSPGSIR